ncbi:hypothetical protein [Azohydromonas australica]|uniref:hypothetical protein n=1 Tax=Azohydromonas australica TaxID=364039 RepID=UPI001EE49E45|nr:hypothetical protein [Azohydromonas australica]
MFQRTVSCNRSLSAALVALGMSSTLLAARELFVDALTRCQEAFTRPRCQRLRSAMRGKGQRRGRLVDQEAVCLVHHAEAWPAQLPLGQCLAYRQRVRRPLEPGTAGYASLLNAQQPFTMSRSISVRTSSLRSRVASTAVGGIAADPRA